MRSPRLLAFAIVCLFSSMAFGQLFPNAPWNKNQCANGQCQTTFGVGSVCSDGAIVTHIGPIADPVPNATVDYRLYGSNLASRPFSYYEDTGRAPAEMLMSPSQSADGASVLSRRSDFRQAFLKAVKEARDKGEISAFQHGRLIVASLRPRELANIQAWVHENAIQEGLATTQAPDWDAIIDFIERLIPLIMQLIDLFSSNVNPHSDFQYAMAQPQTESRVRCDWSWTGLAA